MPWERYFETGAVAGSGSRSVMVEQAAEEVASAGGHFNQVLEDRPAREYAMESPEREEGPWMLQEAVAGGERDLCAEAGEEVADSVYHEGNARPVRRVQWDLCMGRPEMCDVERGGWGPSDSGVPYPNVFLQTNLRGDGCLPANRLLSGRGVAPWIAHLRMRGVMDAGFAQGNEVLMVAEGYAEAEMVAGLLVGLWSPADLTTALLWLDGADQETMTITAEGRVSEWRDKSGNNFAARQESNLIRPTYDGAIRGHGALNFLGGSANLDVVDFVKGPNLYIIFVAQHDLGQSDVAFTYFDSVQEQQRIFLRTFADRASLQLVTRGLNEGDGSDVEAVSLSGLNLGGDPIIISCASAGASSFLNYNATQRIVGATLGGERFFGLNLGARHGDVQGMGGALGEFIVLEGVPDNETQRKLEGYLAHKWGMQDRIPSDHPYRSLPPTAKG